MSSSATPKSLSPSRAGDFEQCPQLFKYRAIDRRPEPPSTAASLGTLVHAVLEDLFALPPEDRTFERTPHLVGPAWKRQLEERPELDAMLADEGLTTAAWLAKTEPLLRSYFTLENPQVLAPSGLEQRVTAKLREGLTLRGIIDRVETAPNGAVRIVDYKSGKAPAPQWQGKTIFQMHFYALMWSRLYDRIPDVLELLFLKDGVRLSIRPDQAALDRTEAKIEGIWADILRALERDHWPARVSKLCDWCHFKPECPAHN